MRNILKGIVTLIICIVLVFLLGREETYYTREGIVTKCNKDAIIIVDNIGKKWICDNCYKDVTKDSEVKMIMHNNHTNTIYDDIVTNIKVK